MVGAMYCYLLLEQEQTYRDDVEGYIQCVCVLEVHSIMLTVVNVSLRPVVNANPPTPTPTPPG